MQRDLDQEGEDFDEEKFFVNCPTTLLRVKPEIIFPNKRMKEAVADYVDHNPWAFEFKPNEDYVTIKLR